MFLEEDVVWIFGAMKKKDDIPDFDAVAGPPGETNLRVMVS